MTWANMSTCHPLSCFCYCAWTHWQHHPKVQQDGFVPQYRSGPWLLNRHEKYKPHGGSPWLRSARPTKNGIEEQACEDVCLLLWPLLPGGIRCQLDAWSEYTTAGGPDGRQDSSMVWDIETQSALLFGGHASNAFLYFEDLWRYDWLQRAWREIRPIGPKPSTRSGHAAVWDPQSRSMIIFAGHFLASFYDDLWQFLEEGSWKLVAVAPAPQAPQARAYHTAILDTVENALLAFGGQGESSQVLGDLWRYSLVERQWSQLATGPGARSRHSAVWAALTRQMLVFAGWSGEQYLQDLRYYDASADRWGEVLAAGHWPAARNGHATAWDPVSKSMLVMGGTQNASDVLSYTNSLYNFSLLSGLWHEEGLQAGVPRPSGRTALAMVWDEKSRGLFAFGGFNASYLQQSWRYAVSQTDPPFVVRCELGSNCSFRFRNAAGIGAKHVCSDSDFLDGLFFVVSEENDWSLESPHLLLEPGHHRLCACESSCSHPRDYQVAIGYFLVEGPYSDQSAQCYLGSVCTINAWRGVGISVNDSVVMQSRCMRSSEASTNYPWERAIGVSFNETYGWHSLQVGLLEKTGKPETVELCWCPKSSACRSAADFLVVALRLEILCPPGEHSGGQSCLLCPADHFCPGGVELQSCPFASTSQPGSRPALSGHVKAPEKTSLPSSPCPWPRRALRLQVPARALLDGQRLSTVPSGLFDISGGSWTTLISKPCGLRPC